MMHPYRKKEIKAEAWAAKLFMKRVISKAKRLSFCASGEGGSKMLGD